MWFKSNSGIIRATYVRIAGPGDTYSILHLSRPHEVILVVWELGSLVVETSYGGDLILD